VTALADILNATSKPCPIVMGLRLVPFSVGHALLLHRMGSPFVYGGNASAQDLVEVAVVCSQPIYESVKTMRSWLRWLPLRIMRQKVKQADLLKESKAVQKWIEDQSDCPEVLRSPGSGQRAATMPWPERILVGLVNIGFDETTVINMPVIDAERLFLTHAEMNGQVELWSNEQDALWRYAQEQSTIRN
jgi:hypothetical protein